MAIHPVVRIGTRGSPLALAQTHETRDRLIAADPALAATGAVEVVVIKTTGDKVQDRALSEIGGKGLFTKEIDEAMLDGRIDLAVHSVKDVPTWLPDGIELACILPREDPRDVFLSRKAAAIGDLAPGSVVGTASLRRQAQVLNMRPDLKVQVFRGNVQTRLRKLDEGEVDATLLALAGLKRLGVADMATSIIETKEVLPAVGQGAVGITCRTDDAALHELLAKIHHAGTAACVAAERALLEELDGSCRTPIAALATVTDDGVLVLDGLLARPDGSTVLKARREGKPGEAAQMGHEAGRELAQRAGPGFIDW
ncbi:MAG: hydroxymethylbilane synthase [Rhodospirillales bacterium]|jgi:hydroxymethylbilane synthase|nr:hydroxymethylbilane synthase [Rhodospirillales bacterium]